MPSLNGRSPTTLASAAIYIAAELCGISRSLDDVSKICGAAMTTIRSICKQMQGNLAELVPDEFKAKKLQAIPSMSKMIPLAVVSNKN